MPLKNLTIVPSVRVENDDANANAKGIGTLLSSTNAFSGHSIRDLTQVIERVDARYTGVTNWVFSAAGQWTEGTGSLREEGGFSQVIVSGNPIGVAPVHLATDDTSFLQKYSLGARWYPVRRVSVDVGGYYKRNEYDYTHSQDSTPNDPSSTDRYPGYLVMLHLKTYDGNARLTLKPWQNVTLISHYDYQYSTIYSQPDPVSGLDGVTSATMVSHMIGQNISWVPWTRLYLQVGFDYVLSETKTPITDFTGAVQHAQNNYWMVNFNSGFVVDNKTDLDIGGFYYRADDGQQNLVTGIPLGADARQYGVTAGITRRLTQNLRLNLKYGYSHYNDYASGGLDNYEAHTVYSSVQYRF
jgi:opacity protein-like surface antigen